MSAPERVAAGTLAELEAQRLLLVPLTPDMSGRPREALVVLDQERTPRAYLNLCRHLPIPLDAGSRRFLIDDQLECGTHGARYRLRDGMCVSGPCRGLSLFALRVEVIAGVVYVYDELSH